MGCPHCGFALEQADEVFGGEDVRMTLLSDGAGLFRRADRVVLEEALGGFMERFPQLFFAVHTGAFTEVTSLRQFGFWLLNRAAYVDVDLARPNECGVLLVIDAESKSATMTWGYRLDPFLDEDDSFDCLSAAHPFWLEGDYRRGVLALVKRLGKILVRRARKARRDPDRFERRVAPPAVTGALVERIRAGNRPAGRRRQADVREEGS